jgi:holo-[acyl-carrier protein] synthase
MPGKKINRPRPSDPRLKGQRVPGVPGGSGVASLGTLAGTPGIVVGVDLVEVDRIAQAIVRFGSRFFQRIFTPEELEQSHRRTAWLAGRFAAKEACAKALGTGVGAAAAWRDMQILRQPGGKPSLRLLGDAAERAAALSITQVDLSISHTHQYAVAIVVALIAPAGAGAEGHSPGAAAGHPCS